MENTNRVLPSRSLVRRLVAPSGVAIALLGGGGWGVYQFTSDTSKNSVAWSEDSAESASAAKDELKNLFASDIQSSAPAPPIQTKTTDRSTLQTSPVRSPAVSDRYAPTSKGSPSTEPVNAFTLPPVRQTEEGVGLAGEKTEPKQPPVTTVDRYAISDAELPPLPPLQPTPAPNLVEAAANEADVTRGQEPSANPLRSAAPQGANLSDDQGPAKSPTAATNPFAVEEPASAALSQARPLQQNLPAHGQSRQIVPVNNRYQPSPSPDARYAPTGGRPQVDVQQTSPSFAQDAGRKVPPQTAPPKQVFAGQSRPASPLTPLGGAENITPTPGLTNHPGTGRPGERLLEGLQSPSIAIQKLAPAEIQVGKRCTFAVRVQNTGQRTAQHIEIHDEIPLGTELVGTAPRASVSGSQVIWELGTLSVGEERTVEMEVLPVEEGNLGSVATVLVGAQASAKSRCTRPELALRLSASKPQVLLGEQQLVQIEISNPGSGDATGVMLLETVPTGVSHEAGPTLEFEVGTLRAGESRRLELVLSAEKAGKINNVMTARADASLQIEAECEFEVIAPELELSIEGPQKRFLERPATYRVTVDNPGTATAYDVQLLTHLPKGLQFVSANNMGEYDSAAHTVEWNLIELQATEHGAVELVALPIEPGSQTLQVAAKARQGLEDRIEKEVQVDGLAALMFQVADLADPIEVGGETTYEIRVVNQGSKASTNVQVVAILPTGGLRALSGQGETRHTIDGNRVVFAPLPSLGPKAETTYRIQVQGIRSGDQRLKVQLRTDDTLDPITKEESTRVYADK